MDTFLQLFHVRLGPMAEPWEMLQLNLYRPDVLPVIQKTA